MTMSEVTDASEIVHSIAHPDANIIFGSVIDDTIGDAVRVTVIAAGFDHSAPSLPTTTSAPVMTEGPRSDIFGAPPTMTSSTLVAMTTCPASSASDELIQQVSANVADVRSRIASAGREPQSVRIVAVTKTFAPQMVRAAYEAGLRTIERTTLTSSP